MKRLKDEKFDTYRKRRSDENYRIKNILKGENLEYVKGMKLGKDKKIK